jgi:hypothetical protein
MLQILHPSPSISKSGQNLLLKLYFCNNQEKLLSNSSLNRLPNYSRAQSERRLGLNFRRPVTPPIVKMERGNTDAHQKSAPPSVVVQCAPFLLPPPQSLRIIRSPLVLVPLEATTVHLVRLPPPPISDGACPAVPPLASSPRGATRCHRHRVAVGSERISCSSAAAPSSCRWHRRLHPGEHATPLRMVPIGSNLVPFVLLNFPEIDRAFRVDSGCIVSSWVEPQSVVMV